MTLNTHHILGLEHLASQDISLILDTAQEIKRLSPCAFAREAPLRGKTVINLFYEPSTRTRMSFELAGKTLGAEVLNFTTASSSIVKGETIKDTVLTLQALAPDFIVVRHSAAGVGSLLAPHVSASIINAGDGGHEHPTQALLDLLTIRENRGAIAGLRVAIIGDITHSRVARSNIWGLTKLGADVRVAGPATMVPSHIEKLGVSVFLNVEDAIADADVVMCLRIQLERQNKHLLPSLQEYARFFGINEARITHAGKTVMIMHPGPLNRGVEMSTPVADGPQSFILTQVSNGLAVRMALFYLLAGKGVPDAAH
ncbi:MAG TPA: aspartate carbamoyltransferase catalytic subunit [Thermodesulfobacteriota bacterium]|nr:aspartate carbamoyltransferase catalytic subunit [Deltaproteobacteria bacterium]HNR14456.1 aspartate carbamoyltransferase catalytic subunit [Thermodesulfobacteriota bacterium]HNU71308.1 aspartate carbamoyltransferase catalytic subunit [Thermodesulfobacteriota bacterium]HOC38069.1 aspartate carbamoyltransferase catalytic subunit [Thermodesulfobacteriota bacterium]